MAFARGHIEASLKTPESEASSSLNNVLTLNRARQVRHEIGIIADRSYREEIINDEAYSGYRELAEGRESHQLSIDMLMSTRKFAKEHEEKAVRIHQKILRAKSAKVASENDEHFLMENLVVENIQFAQKYGEVERLIDEKLARMKSDKEDYEKLADHKLIKNVGYLKINSGTKIDFPNEAAFLKMTVPDRRDLLKKLEKGLPQAEKHAEVATEKDDKKLRQEYGKKIQEALKLRIIGEKTADKFMDGFRKIDLEEKELWLEEFDEQMTRYETLWDQIRATLREPALQQMERQIDAKGYSELLAEFGQLKKKESLRLTTDYAVALEGYREEGLIGQHSISKFVIWLAQQELGEKYEALDELPNQMLRYEELWKEVADLRPKERQFMRSKIDHWGFSELQKQLHSFQVGGKILSAGVSETDRVLSKLQSSEMRDAIIESGEWLDKQGAAKQTAFLGIITRMFGKENASSFDAISFEGQVRDRARKHNEEIKADLKGKGVNDAVDLNQIEEDVDILEEAESAKVINHDGFIEIKSHDRHGESIRDTQVQINEEKSMERLFAEDTRHTYKSELEGGTDDMSLAISGKVGRTMELDLQSVKVLEEYVRALRADREDVVDEAA